MFRAAPSPPAARGTPVAIASISGTSNAGCGACAPGAGCAGCSCAAGTPRPSMTASAILPSAPHIVPIGSSAARSPPPTNSRASENARIALTTSPIAPCAGPGRCLHTVAQTVHALHDDRNRTIRLGLTRQHRRQHRRQSCDDGSQDRCEVREATTRLPLALHHVEQLGQQRVVHVVLDARPLRDARIVERPHFHASRRRRRTGSGHTMQLSHGRLVGARNHNRFARSPNLLATRWITSRRLQEILATAVQLRNELGSAFVQRQVRHGTFAASSVRPSRYNFAFSSPGTPSKNPVPRPSLSSSPGKMRSTGATSTTSLAVSFRVRARLGAGTLGGGLSNGSGNGPADGLFDGLRLAFFAALGTGIS